jgi:hypothetical protein
MADDKAPVKPPKVVGVVWVEARIPVKIEPGRHGQSYATSPLIKGLLVPIDADGGPLTFDSRWKIASAIEDIGCAAVEATDDHNG